MYDTYEMYDMCDTDGVYKTDNVRNCDLSVVEKPQLGKKLYSRIEEHKNENRERKPVNRTILVRHNTIAQYDNPNEIFRRKKSKY